MLPLSWTRTFWRLWDRQDTRRLLLYLSLNCTFMFLEFTYGALTNSIGLVSDAVHMLFDCLAVAVALAAAAVAEWQPTEEFMYGFGRVEVLGAFVNGLLLIYTSFELLVSSVERMLEPQAISHAGSLFVVSCLGFAVNVCGLVIFHEHAHGNPLGAGPSENGASCCFDPTCTDQGGIQEAKTWNMQGVFLHILADTLGSLAVVISAVLIQCCGITFFDAVTSVVVSILLLMLVWPLIQSASFVMLQRRPMWLDAPVPKALAQAVRVDGVAKLWHARFWCVTPKSVEGSVCLGLAAGLTYEDEEAARRQVVAQLRSQGIHRLFVELHRDGEDDGTLTPSVSNQFSSKRVSPVPSPLPGDQPDAEGKYA